MCNELSFTLNSMCVPLLRIGYSLHGEEDLSFDEVLPRCGSVMICDTEETPNDVKGALLDDEPLEFSG